MKDSSVTLPPGLQAATETLAQQLLQAEPIARYHRAKDALEKDAQARSLLERLSAAQANLRVRQARGSITQDEIRSLRGLQDQVQSNPVIMDYALAQQEALAYLPQVNQTISELLGVDFAALAGPASC